MKEIAFAVICVLGWVGLTAFSLLRLFGVIEVDGNIALSVTLALIPLSISMPWAIDAAAEGFAGLTAALITLVVVAVILGSTRLLDLVDRARESITRKDHLT